MSNATTNAQRIMQDAARIAGAAWDDRDRTGTLADQIRAVAATPPLGADGDLGQADIDALESLAEEALGLSYDGKMYVEAAGEDDTLVCGTRVQFDNSGVGHNWRNATEDNLPAHIVQEIESEMIDGGKDECADYVASNGQHYRW